jgi:hypothetical protein
MTEQRTSPEEIEQIMRDLVPLWMKVVFGGVMLLMAGFAAVSVLRHGSRNLGLLLMSLSMAGLWFFMGRPGEPATSYLKRPLGIVYLLWIAVFTAWFIHDKHWIPGACIGGIFVLGLFRTKPKREGEVWWRYYVRNPLALGSTLLIFLYVGWLAWTMGGWVPLSCIGATFLLAERDFETRRRFSENLRRRSVAARVGLAAIAGLWAWAHPSYWNIVTPIIILILLSSDIYLHTSSHEERLALSHPQS